MIPLFFPPGIPLAIENGLFHFQYRQASPFTPASALFQAGADGRIHIGLDGSGSGDVLILEVHLIGDPLTVVSNVVIEVGQKLLLFGVRGSYQETVHLGQCFINLVG